MKKLLALLLVAVMCLSLVACGSRTNDSSTPQGTENSSIEIENNDNADGTDSSDLNEDISDEITEESRDERFAEGVNPADVDIAQYVGVWWINKGINRTKGNQIEFFEDGRIVLNGETEYQWKEYDGEKFAVYLEDRWLGYGYLYFHEYNVTCFTMETPEDSNLLGHYWPDSYFTD